MAGETRIREALYIGDGSDFVLGEGRDNVINPGSGYDFNVDTDGAGDISLTSGDNLTLLASDDVLLHSSSGGGILTTKSNTNTELVYADAGGSSDYLKLIRSSATIAEFTRAIALTPQTTFTSTTADFDTTINATGTGNILVNADTNINLTSQIGTIISYNAAGTTGGSEDFRVRKGTTTVFLCDENGKIEIDPISGQNCEITSSGAGNITLTSASTISFISTLADTYGTIALEANSGINIDYGKSAAGNYHDDFSVRHQGSTAVLSCTQDGDVIVDPLDGEGFVMSQTGANYLYFNAGADVRIYATTDHTLAYNTAGSAVVSNDFTVQNNTTNILKFNRLGQVDFTPTGSFLLYPSANYAINLTTNGTGDISLTSGDDITQYADDDIVIRYDAGDSSGDFILQRGSAADEVLTINRYGSATWYTAQHIHRYNALGTPNNYSIARGATPAGTPQTYSDVMVLAGDGKTDFYGGTASVVATFTAAGGVEFDPASGQNFNATTLGAGNISLDSSDDIILDAADNVSITSGNALTLTYNDDPYTNDFTLVRNATTLLSCDSDGVTQWTTDLFKIGSSSDENIWRLGEQVFEIDFTNVATNSDAELLALGIVISDHTDVSSGTIPYPTHIAGSATTGSWTWSSGLVPVGASTNSGPSFIVPLMRPHNWEAEVIFDAPTLSSTEGFEVFIGVCGHGGMPVWYGASYNYGLDTEYHNILLGATTDPTTTAAGVELYNGGNDTSAGTFSLKIRSQNCCIGVYDPNKVAGAGWYWEEAKYMHDDAGTPAYSVAGQGTHIFVQIHKLSENFDAPTLTDFNLIYLQ